MFWYCHKRGRETRLEREKTVDSDGRIVEMDDDPLLGEAGPSQSHPDSEPQHGQSTSHDHAHADGQHSNLRPDDRPASSRKKSSESRKKSSESRRPVGAENSG